MRSSRASILSFPNLSDRLLTVLQPDADGDFESFINPHWLEVTRANDEASVGEAESELRYQSERLGYFALDSDSRPNESIFKRTMSLRDTSAQGAKR